MSLYSYHREEVKKICKFCNKEFITSHLHQKYCSEVCRKKYHLIDYEKSGLSKTMSCATKGAFNELVVCIDLLKKGYEVFRSVSPACSCDLAILKNGKLYKVEVTSGWRANGKSHSNRKLNEKRDILAVVFGYEITYQGLPEE